MVFLAALNSLKTAHHFGHAQDQLVQTAVGLAWLGGGIRMQDLRGPRAELTNGEDTLGLQVIKLANGQILAQPCPDRLYRVEVAGVRRKPDELQTELLIHLGLQEELLIVMPENPTRT